MYYILKENAIEGPINSNEEIMDKKLEEGKDFIWKTDENLVFHTLEQLKSYLSQKNRDLLIISMLALSYLVVFFVYMIFGNFNMFIYAHLAVGTVFSLVYFLSGFKKWNIIVWLFFILSMAVPYIFIPFAYFQRSEIIKSKT
jgi:hypothetical protein